MLQPVILCGGDGTRLWPASRRALPKQFMPLHGSTLFIETIRRAAALPETLPPLVICNTAHRFLAAVQMGDAAQAAEKPGAARMRPPEAGAGRILLEPVGKNTAPAVAVAALHCLAEDPLLLVLPADHAIPDTDAFAKSVALGMEAARAGDLVTFGVVPTRPETGFGYVQRGPKQSHGAYSVARFVEKPDQEQAQGYLAAGDYFWNSGMFLFRPSAFLRELGLYSPAILAACEEAYAARTPDLDFIRLDEDAFAACPADSIDYAIMEHTNRAVVVPLDTAWSDLGSWQSLYDVAAPDEAGNVALGDTVTTGCAGSFFLAQSRLIAAVGVENMVVVETPDAVMVAPKGRSQEVKQLVAALKGMGRSEAEEHARVYRPWGSYETLILGERFQVKRIVVTPGHRLSLQKHYHRAEHWVVVRGTALVTINEGETLLGENESTFIPTGAVHRLENPGKVPLEIIEIQTGSYLGEDDIVRLEDVYGR